VKPAI